MRRLGVPLAMVGAGGVVIGYAAAALAGDFRIGVIIAGLCFAGLGVELALSEVRSR